MRYAHKSGPSRCGDGVERAKVEIGTRQTRTVEVAYRDSVYRDSAYRDSAR